ncbi:hypothetical protein D3C86_1470870 [compost metagenome]
MIRGLPRVSNKPPTLAQSNQRFKFGLVTGFLSRIAGFIDLGFGSLKGSASPMNSAVAYHLTNAITGVAPNFLIDYTKLRINKGKLELPGNIVVALTVPARIDFTWVNIGQSNKYKDPTDVANIVVYNPTKDTFTTLKAAAARSTLGYNLLVPPDYSGDQVHVYISFSSTIQKKLVSETEYIGQLLLL